MPTYEDIVYRYDGTIEGLMCCIFESYARDQIPVLIEVEGAQQMSLFPVRRVETSAGIARRVTIAIHQKICPDALVLVRLGFLTCLEEKEMHLLRFIRLGFEQGSKVMGLVADSRVDILLKAVNYIKREQHLYKGFVRFSDIDNVLVAEIEPKNFVLPLIAIHFAERFSGETFMIYDKTNKAALLYKGGQKEIVKLDSFTIPEASPQERGYRALWKRFYDTVAVEGRENPRCRMSLMPKRYWGVMTEFLEQGQPRDEGKALDAPEPRLLEGRAQQLH